MLKRYRMPNGHTYQFDDASVPAGAVLIEPEKKAKKKAADKPKSKAKKAPANKAKKSANKAKKAAVK